MAIHLVTGTNTTSQTAGVSDDTYVLTKGSGIYATNGFISPGNVGGMQFVIHGDIVSSNSGIFSNSWGDHDVWLSMTGSIYSEASGVALLANPDTSPGSRVINEGQIVAADYGIRIEGEGSVAVNAGSIAAETGIYLFVNTTTATADFSITNSGSINATASDTSDGIHVYSASLDVEADVVNTGSIVATDIAVNLVSQGLLTNSGLIESLGRGVNSVAVNGDDRSQEITNSGTINGHVTLGGGNDSFTMLAGTLRGDVYLGAGDDDFVFRDGAVDGIVYGDSGNDVFYVHTKGATIKGGAGIDEVHASVSFDLGQSSDIERLYLTGLDDIKGIGSIYGDTITGNAGDNIIRGRGDADILEGGGGADLLAGNWGDDTFYVQDGGDTIRGGAGTDHVSLDSADESATINLLNQARNDGSAEGSTFKSIESFFLSEDDDLFIGANGADTVWGFTGSDTLKGNGGDDVLYGGARVVGWDTSDDTLFGGNGADYLDGDVGDDVLNGGNGADTLVGDDGADTLTGGKGADVFDFNFASGGGLDQTDTITDFAKGVDVIDLSDIDADTGLAGDQAFALGGNAFTGTAGELIVFKQGGNTHVQGDVDGDGLADLSMTLLGKFVLVAGDFVL